MSKIEEKREGEIRPRRELVCVQDRERGREREGERERKRGREGERERGKSSQTVVGLNTGDLNSAAG